MIPVELISDKIPESNFRGFLIQNNNLNKLPSQFKEALNHFPTEDVLDLLVEDGKIIRRCLGVRINNFNRKELEEAGSRLIKKALNGKDKVLQLDLRDFEAASLDILMGVYLSDWTFDLYKTKKKSSGLKIEKIQILCSDLDSFAKKLEEIKAVCSGVIYARELTSEPPNTLPPVAYAEKLLELKSLGIEVEILDEDALNEIGMKALLAVSAGSVQPPRVVVLRWNGADVAESPICLVGKGVCFDSGGICLKNTEHQLEMKWDKAGAGVVVGTLKALALKKSKRNVIGIIGLTENMPDGKAIKPGDVIRTMSGQTVEIVNTDAEGRLVLADCIWYAQKRFQPQSIIDLGTLTPEVFASLGTAYAGLYTNNFLLSEALTICGNETGDLVWELPMGDYFAKQIESDVADIKNLGLEDWGECGAAAEFLKRFVENSNWAHIDIAGVSWTNEDLPLSPKGVTGFGVRLLDRWLS